MIDKKNRNVSLKKVYYCEIIIIVIGQLIINVSKLYI